jgi:putative addiction module component (TIGR02574 family)
VTRYIPDMASTEIAELLAKAMRLPPDERLAIATELFESVEGPEDASWTAAWAAELDRRAKDLESGKVQAVPWEQAKAEILERLRAK